MVGKYNYIPTELEKEAQKIMKEVMETTGMPCTRAGAYNIILNKSRMVKVPITPSVLRKFLLGDKKWTKEEIYNQ